MTTADIMRWNGQDPVPSELRGGAVAVGNFDGVHLGHVHLVRLLRNRARPAVVVTFDPHPMQILARERFQPLLNTPGDRAAYLLDVGADGVTVLATTPELLRLTAEEFFTRVLVGGFQPRAIVEGFNFHFGRDRAGDTKLLANLCQRAGIQFDVASPFELDGVVVSSSRVRTALQQGDVIEARRLMGRPYGLSGEVERGDGRGRTLGFPTANLGRIQTLIPGDGVYAVRVRFEDRSWAGAANIGPNPTFGGSDRKVEVHLIDFQGDLYGRSLRLEFLRRLRPTVRFRSADELAAQLRADVSDARKAHIEEGS